jgi:CRISPR type III-B/RAMP module RAMP protein Cmr6
VSRLPLPPTIAAHFAPDRDLNLALRFERGMDGYDAQWRFAKRATGEPDQGKSAFLAAYAALFNRTPAQEFEVFLARRDAALGSLGLMVTGIEMISRSRLVVGLGLPHPTETGFLLDRLTGSPYLPGSSIKGALRAAARWTAEGELLAGREPSEHEDARRFWLSDRDRIFGPAIGDGSSQAQGSAVFFDAFPAAWPRLEVDVLVPHYGAWYGGGDEPPADCENPIPVAFLTVAARTPFRFYLGARGATAGADLLQLRRLIEPAFGLLGLGGKRSSGYGVLVEKPVRTERSTRSRAKKELAATPSAASPGDEPKERQAATPPRNAGDKIKVLVIGEQGGCYTLRDIETGQDDIVLKAMVPWAVGEHRKVRVEKVSADGRVLKVRT